MREAVLIASPEEALARAAVDAEAHQGLAGVDPDAEPQRRSADGLELLGVLGDPKARADGALRIVLMAAGTPKTPDHGIADELLDRPAERFDPPRAIAK